MTPEQIEGYLKRLNVRYSHDDQPGPDGSFHVRFQTAVYRSTLPPHGSNQVQLIVTLGSRGRLLTLSAPYVYLLHEAKKRAVFCEYLIDLNYRIKVAQFRIDRRDGEVACQVSIPVDGSNISFEAFRHLLYVIPFVLDHHHAETIGVMKKGKLPPVPKAPQVDLMLVDILQRVGGSVTKLHEIVNAHEQRLKGPENQPSKKHAVDDLLNPLPPAIDSPGDDSTPGGTSANCGE